MARKTPKTSSKTPAAMSRPIGFGQQAIGLADQLQEASSAMALAAAWQRIIATNPQAVALMQQVAGRSPALLSGTARSSGVRRQGTAGSTGAQQQAGNGAQPEQTTVTPLNAAGPRRRNRKGAKAKKQAATGAQQTGQQQAATG